MSARQILLRSPNRLITAIAVLLLGACSTLQVGSHYDETNNFGLYRSFSWIDDSPYIQAPSRDAVTVSPLTQAKIERAIRRQLETMGYVFVADRTRADFVIAYTVGTRRELTIDAYPVIYRGPWGWHVYGSLYYPHEVHRHEYVKGTLAVDIFDARSRRPVWHGWAEKTVTSDDRRNPGPSIDAAVENLLMHFPR